jgi:selenide,water dikinase
VTGIVHPDKIVTNAAAQPGDQLVLTKPIGTGILATALKRGKGTPELLERMAETMWTLNDVAGLAMVEHGAHAATDITGCGFIGHAWEMAHGSKVNIRVHALQVPIFEEALVFAKRGYLTQGDVSNREYTRGAVNLDKGVAAEMVQVMFDPQTSGGLLIALPPAQASALVETLHTRGVGSAVIVGEVEPGDGTIMVIP